MTILDQFDVRAILRSMGVPRRWMRTKREVEIFKHRSEGAKRGWKTRKASPLYRVVTNPIACEKAMRDMTEGKETP